MVFQWYSKGFKALGSLVYWRFRRGMGGMGRMGEMGVSRLG
jgi:hypothetical protein